LSLLALSACRAEEPVVARVGDDVITAREFVQAYEFGFPDLKTGSDPRAAYLNRMIAERLLSIEGYRRGLDREPGVARRIRSMYEELMVEQVFEERVNRGILVTEAEIDSARFRDVVTFRLRFFPAASEGDARRIGEIFRGEGFQAAAAARAAEIPGMPMDDRVFETGYLSPSDVDPVLMERIASLPLGDISAPIPYRGSHLIVQVADVQRSPVTDVASPADQDRFRQVVFQTKARAAARSFIKETLSPSELRLKPQVYRELEASLWDWIRGTGDPGANLEQTISADPAPEAERVRTLYDRVIMETADDSWTVRLFLSEYPADRYPLSSSRFEVFRENLYDAFGLLLRDRAFVKMAEEAGHNRRSFLQDDLARWSDKWVYQALVAAIRDSVSVSPQELESYFERHRSFWPEESTLDTVRGDVERRALQAMVGAEILALVHRLRGGIPVEIHPDVLASLDLTDPSGSAAPSVMLFKGHTGRPAFPVVDYRW
jgi:hypothetical protein